MKINKEKNTEQYLLELNNKLGDIADIKKISYLLVCEIWELLKPDYLVIIEYSQQNTKILAQIPVKVGNLESVNSHELFLIIKNLQQLKEKYISRYDLKSEHFKNSFPLFNEENFLITPLYSDKEKTITIEIYGENLKTIILKKKFLGLVIETFKKFYTQNAELAFLLQKKQKDEVLINFLDKIRNAFDEKILEKNILEAVADIFHADRTYFLIIFKELSRIPIYKNEYLSNLYAKSLIGNKLDTSAVWQQVMENQLKPVVFTIENTEKFIKQNDFQDTPLDIFIQKSEMKSSYPTLVFEDEKTYTYLIIDYTREFFVFTQKDFKLMELLSRQINIAFTQLKLYEKLVENTKKEKILREVISDTIKLNKKEDIFHYFSEKIISVFEANGIAYIEFLGNGTEDVSYFEYYKATKLNLSKFKNVEVLLDEIKMKNVNYTCDLEILKNNIDAKNFFEETGTTCIGTLPILENVVAIIFFEKQRIFSQYDRDLLFSLTDIMSKKLIDALKTTEINSLRDNFLATLSHDLQIPLIAQKNAIKYLLEQDLIKNTPKIYELLITFKENNSQVESMLKSLMDIYKYESNKKVINKEKCDLNLIIQNAIKKIHKEQEVKKIIINEVLDDSIGTIFGDFKEISKALILILENIIEYSEVNSQITITTMQENKKIKCCIQTNASLFSETQKELLFSSDLSNNTLEYKVGDGIKLYLAKLILKEHNANLYFSEDNEDLTICMEIG